MKSNLNLITFKKRLAALTSEEKGLYFLTPYNSSGTPFCGTYNESAFALTRNTFWSPTKDFVVKGEYKRLDDHSTEVTYEIRLTKSMRIFSIVFNVVTFTVANVVAILNKDTFETSFFSILLTQNSFLIIANLWAFLINWITKGIINQRFKEEFEIEDVGRN